MRSRALDVFALCSFLLVGCAGEVDPSDEETPDDGALGVAQQPLGGGASFPSISDVDATKVVTYGTHACARRPSGALACWGNNTWGQLGRGATGASQPYAGNVTVVPTAADLSNDGSGYTCILRPTDGVVQCWGLNQSATLSVFANGSYPQPITVPGIAYATTMGGGNTANCAISNSVVQCWGRQSSGVLGDGMNTGALKVVPQPVSGIANAVEIAASSQAHCARTNAGAVYCWGAGFIQPGPSDGMYPMRQVSLPSPATSIGVMNDRACASHANGTVSCWTSTVGSSAPLVATPLAGLNGTAVSVTAGSSHACAIMSDKTLRCWGTNTYGQLGNGTITSSLPPVPVSNLTNVTQVSIAGFSTCAVAAGYAYCWGNNYDGQVGNGTTATRTTPAKVQWPPLVIGL